MTNSDVESQLDNLLNSETPETGSYHLNEILKAADDALPGVLTLDKCFKRSISDLQTELNTYLSDSSLRRPYNVLMIAAPGSGKSHFVKCLGKALSGYRGSTEVEVAVVTGNLSSLDPLNALHIVVNEARNHKTIDTTPVLFLDEIDSNPNLLAVLLPLLWDGEIFLSGQKLTLGRCIIICSISDQKLINYICDPSDKSVRETIESRFGKVVDFMSRINGGVFKIPSINSENRHYDKICIAAELYRRRFPKVDGFSISFLRLISYIEFVHEIRSLETLINFMPIPYYDVLIKKNVFILYSYDHLPGFDYINENLLQNKSRQRDFWKNHTRVKDPRDLWNRTKGSGGNQYIIYFSKW